GLSSFLHRVVGSPEPFGRMPKHNCCRKQVVEELSSNFTSTFSALPQAGTRNCFTAGERPAINSPGEPSPANFHYAGAVPRAGVLVQTLSRPGAPDCSDRTAPGTPVACVHRSGGESRAQP